jgi:MFS family permease
MSSLYWLLSSRFLGGLGYQIFMLSGLFEIYQRTQSTTMTGLTGLVLFVPAMILNLGFGQWADRVRGKAFLYFLLQVAILPLSCAMILPEVRSSSTALLVLMGLYSVIRGLRTPLYYTLMNLSSLAEKNPVSKGRLAQISTVSWQGPLILGPFLFSFLQTTGGHSFVTFILVGFFVLAAVTSLPLVFKKLVDVLPAVSAVKKPWRDLFKENPVWIQASLMDALVMGSLSFVSLIPFLLKSIQEDPSQIGYMRSAISAGAFTCISLFEVQALQKFRQQLFLGALLVASLAVLLIPATTSLLVLIGLCFVFGFCDGFSILYRDYLVFMVPKEVTGRVSSLSQILNSASEDLGEFRAGLLGSAFGPAQALVISAIFGGTLTIGYGLSYFKTPEFFSAKSENFKPFLKGE